MASTGSLFPARTSAPRGRAVQRTGIVLCALLAVADIVGMFLFGLGTAPIGVVILTTGLGLATLVGAAFAWRGSTRAVWVTGITRVVAALGVIPILLVPDAPKDAVPMAISMLAVTVVAAALLVVRLHRAA